MKIIRLAGFVGGEYLNSSIVSQLLTEAAGEDITVHLSTQGGNVYDGVEIYNLINNYEGKKKLILGGTVASIGSYIATAFDEVEAQDISIFMVHNASNFVYGDYLELRNQADRLEKLNKHIADRLARFTNKKVEDVLALMAEESWYYGKEILDNGFATSYVETGKAQGNPKDVLDFAQNSFHKSFNSVAVFMGTPKPKKEEEIMPISKEDLKKEFTFEQVVDAYEAKGKLITVEQIAKLDALNAMGITDPAVQIKGLQDAVNAGKKTIIDAELDKVFGKAEPTNLLRTRADELTLAGKTVDEIRKDPIAVMLAGKRADSGSEENVLGFVEPDKKPAEDKDAIKVVRY
jgi:ATP-dependent protease ClpP protease subunit